MDVRQIKAVVFDLDGTLVEFNLNYKRLRSDVINFLSKQGLPISLFSTNDRMASIVEKTKRLMTNNGRSNEKIRETEKNIFSIVDQYEMEAARTTRMAPGVIPTLKALKERSIKIGIFTLSGRRSTEYILNRFHIKEFFDAIVPREDATEAKPDPEHLRLVLKMLNVNPQKTMVVGDSETDMVCAKQLNAIAVGVLNKRTSVDQLISAGADYTISSFTDLITLVSDINK